MIDSDNFPLSTQLIFSDGEESIQRYLQSDLHQEFINSIAIKPEIDRGHFFKFPYAKEIGELLFAEVLDIKCFHKNDYLGSYSFRDFDVDLDSENTVSINQIAYLVEDADGIATREFLQELCSTHFADRTVETINLSNDIFPLITDKYLISLLRKAPNIFTSAIQVLELYDRATRKISDYEYDKSSFIQNTKGYWFQRRFGHEDIADILTGYHIEYIEKALTPKPKPIEHRASSIEQQGLILSTSGKQMLKTSTK